MNTVEINIARLYHLLKLFRLTKDEFLVSISEGLKNQITEKEIFKNEIKISHLKKIDKIFNKGINYYLDPKAPKEFKEESIFFRKDTFNTELNLGSKKIVTQFEEEKISLSALSKLSNLKIERALPFYSINDNPRKVAKEVREFLYPSFINVKKEFLKALIAKFAEHNILVFEFVETWNKKGKANLNGIYLAPNVIVLKRQQKSFRREIFTLIHELGHYLINEEEIDKIEDDNIFDNSQSNIERWCNEFAFHFLIGNYDDTFSSLPSANSQNDYHSELISQISRGTHLSKIALYTSLVITNKISQKSYNLIKKELYNAFLERQKEEEFKKELDKAKGIKRGGSTSKPIKSPLLVHTIQSAYFEGVISESEFCRKLNIKPKEIDKYLQ